MLCKITTFLAWAGADRRWLFLLWFGLLSSSVWLYTYARPVHTHRLHTLPPAATSPTIRGITSSPSSIQSTSFASTTAEIVVNNTILAANPERIGAHVRIDTNNFIADSGMEPQDLRFIYRATGFGNGGGDYIAVTNANWWETRSDHFFDGARCASTATMAPPTPSARSARMGSLSLPPV